MRGVEQRFAKSHMHKQLVKSLIHDNTKVSTENICKEMAGSSPPNVLSYTPVALLVHRNPSLQALFPSSSGSSSSAPPLKTKSRSRDRNHHRPRAGSAKAGFRHFNFVPPNQPTQRLPMPCHFLVSFHTPHASRPSPFTSWCTSSS
jgi:hypothetical protein